MKISLGKFTYFELRGQRVLGHLIYISELESMYLFYIFTSVWMYLFLFMLSIASIIISISIANLISKNILSHYCLSLYLFEY